MYQLAGPFTLMLMTREGGEGTPLYGLYRYVRLQRAGFSAVLVINRVWFLCSSLDCVCFLEEATSSSLSVLVDKTDQQKSPS